MARRGKGVGGGHRLALRGFSQILKDLPRVARLRLESAFVETEDLMDFHVVNANRKTKRRRLNSVLESPVVTVENSILGGSVFWARLEDPRILFYEVQVDNVNVFPDPETFQVREPFFSVDRINTRSYIRVRGVRTDGQVGNWSNTVNILPSLAAPIAHTTNFYQRYEGVADPELAIKTDFGGEPTPKFYTIFEDKFYNTRNVGGMGVFGFVSNRLKEFRDSNIKPWDRVRFSVNGISRTEGYFCHWSDASVQDLQTADVFLKGQFYEQPISFYSRGGYTASFGPYGIAYPNTKRGDGFKDPRKVTTQDAGDQFYWQDPKEVKRPTRWDRSILTDVTAADDKDEAYVKGLLTGKKTEWLKCQDFGFNVPEGVQITGIKAAIKRRQNLIVERSMKLDSGFAPVNKAFTSGGSSESDIVEDVNWGKYLDMTTPGARSWNNTENTSIGINNQWTLSTWWNFSTIPLAGINFMSIKDPGSPLDWFITFQLQNNTGAGRVTLQYGSNRAPFSTQSLVFNNFITTAGAWVHILVTWNGTSPAKVYKDGTFVNPTFSFLSGPAPTFAQDSPVHINIPDPDNNSYAYNVGQTALWNRELHIDEIEFIAASLGRIDLRENQVNYVSKDNLMHYWFFFPDQADIEDYRIRLIDSNNTIRDDIDDKSIAETWPGLADFFYANVVDSDGLPIATSTGIAHDSVTGIGYQEYGGTNDLWGAEHHIDGFYDVLVSPTALNSPNFGLAIRAQNTALKFTGNAFIDHVKMQVFWDDLSINRRFIDLKVEAEAATHFYFVRETYGSIINGIEVGEIL